MSCQMRMLASVCGDGAKDDDCPLTIYGRRHPGAKRAVEDGPMPPHERVNGGLGAVPALEDDAGTASPEQSLKRSRTDASEGVASVSDDASTEDPNTGDNVDAAADNAKKLKGDFL